jgi:hypothetical protein
MYFPFFSFPLRFGKRFIAHSKQFFIFPLLLEVFKITIVHIDQFCSTPQQLELKDTFITDCVFNSILFQYAPNQILSVLFN